MNLRFLALLPALLPLSAIALEPAHAASLDGGKRQAIFVRAESGTGLVGFLPEGMHDWRLSLYPFNGPVTAFALSDFDGDGLADLALIKSGGEFATMPGDGKGGFTLKGNSRGILRGFVPVALQVIDINGDGNPDISLFDGKRRLDLKNDGFGNLEPAAAAKSTPEVGAELFSADFFGRGSADGIEIGTD